MTALIDARWYFDVISPFAFLQWRQLARLRARVAITPVPILFAAVLNQHGQKGPAEIAGKREFTYRFVQWQAERAGITLRFPPGHPFNPLHALRLCVAAGATTAAIDAIFDHLWIDGRAGDSPEALAPVAARLGIVDVAAATAVPEVKDTLKRNTQEALTRGVFGVPTLAIGEELFWGNDATDMILDWLADPGRFATGQYARLRHLPSSAERPR